MNTFACPQCVRLNRVHPDKADSAKCGHCSTPLDVSGRPLKVDDDGLDRLTRSSPVPVLVDFYADWCGPCRMLSPVLDQLGEKHAGRLIVAKVDTERFQRRAQQLGVRGIPLVVLYKDGKEVDRLSGMRPLPAWMSMVGRHVAP